MLAHVTDTIRALTFGIIELGSIIELDTTELKLDVLSGEHKWHVHIWRQAAVHRQQATTASRSARQDKRAHTQ
jgi:hypothetical protein